VAWLIVLALPILEIAVAALVASWIGFGWMLLLLVGLSFLGILLLPRVGISSYTRVRQSIERGEDPSREIVSRMLLLLAAVLLILPGFITGAIGLVLLLPPVRHAAARAATGRIHSRVQVVRATYGRGPVIEAESTEVPTPPRPELDR
jgi:UPF0716 protein FxsA